MAQNGFGSIEWGTLLDENDHDKVLRRDDEDLLPVMPAAFEEVFRGIGILAAPVQPEEGAILPFAGGSRRRRVFHPAFRKDPRPVPRRQEWISQPDAWNTVPPERRIPGPDPA